ncbi:hypothetical protein CLV51_102334 [Chitinophaga niastensis]|uniref:Uncharacterized protein n=1 Tax=Chitinophaga niastensis TaxID=536980 RepID=A0A2P8HMQ5_CHINA|nr:hypothetical protein CLV51_102334 [Chitinophaga niastensis]
MDKQRTEQTSRYKSDTDGRPGVGRIVSSRVCQPESLCFSTTKVLINLVLLINLAIFMLIYLFFNFRNFNTTYRAYNL